MCRVVCAAVGFAHRSHKPATLEQVSLGRRRRQAGHGSVEVTARTTTRNVHRRGRGQTKKHVFDSGNNATSAPPTSNFPSLPLCSMVSPRDHECASLTVCDQLLLQGWAESQKHHTCHGSSASMWKRGAPDPNRLLCGVAANAVPRRPCAVMLSDLALGLGRRSVSVTPPARLGSHYL